MGRPLRQALGGVVYHLLNRRVLRLPLFEDDGDYLVFWRVLAEGEQIILTRLLRNGRKGDNYDQ